MADKGNIKHLTDENFEKEVGHGVTLIDFHAQWCAPCRMLAPLLEEVAKEVKGKASIGKVDIDTEHKTAEHFQITSVPTLVLVKNGKELKRLVGLRKASEIKEFVESAM
jgi:thioredoxin 1